MPNKTYHVVMVIEDGTNLQSSDLFIDDVKAAQEYFKKMCKEEFALEQITDEAIEKGLDEGYVEFGNTVVMYTEPYSIFGKE
jgi:hypothetical protein